ncbi:MAG TPA: AMIN domain-containing protein [Methylomirabilota bacterium]|nr:AMIN domain-containing protein [Methylomirabilota bacterium]
MKAIVSSVGLLLLLTVVAAGTGTAQTPDAAVQVTSLSVDRLPDGVTVRIKTSGPAKYQSSFIDYPNRLVVDLPDATYTWSKTTLKSDTEPVRQVRGSQWKGSVARVVVELSRKVGYRIDQDAEGLLIVLEPAGTAQAEKPATKPHETKAKVRPAPAEAWAPRVETPRLEARAPDVTKDVTKTEAAPDKEAMATVTPAPLSAVEPKAAPAPARIAQAGSAAPPPAPGPAPAPTPPPAPGAPSMPSGQALSSGKLISLDFRDADVVNLLRILAAESGRNIVAGEDVKGKVSVSLHNVTWEQALDTILEARGLQRLDRNGIIRIVSIEQLTKEREAQARVQEAQVKAETEIRTKRADAEFKEAEAAYKKLQADAAISEAKSRGPLREETIRLSYADPEEVAKTLQGILGIPPSGTQPVSSAPIIQSVPQNPTVVGSSPPNPALGRLPEPNSPYPPVPIPQNQQVVSVSQDVLAKGITIQAHKPTNSIFIRHYEADLERIKKLIKEKFDIPLPQVKIEARMEILDRSAFEGIGVQWGGAGAGNINNTTTIIGQGFQSASSKTAAAIAATQGVLLPDGSTVRFDPVGIQGFSPNNPGLTLSQLFPISATTGLPMGGNVVNLPFAALPGSAAAGSPAGGISFGLVSSNFNINLALQALAAQGKTRTLARPEIVTVENSKASISLGEEIPYATVSSAGTQIQFKEAVLKLDVLPTVLREQIGANVVTKIKMVVVIENNSRGENINPGGTSTVPVINKRKAETQVLIKEGDRLVIGGVTQGVSSTTVRKVPLFGDIPIFGWLFKQKENTELGRELVIFVTPSLVTGQGSAGLAITPVAPK